MLKRPLNYGRRMLRYASYPHRSLVPFRIGHRSFSSSTGSGTISKGLFIISVASFSYVGYAYYDYTSTGLPFNTFALIRPILFRFDPEQSHVHAVRAGSFPKYIRNALGMVYNNGITDPSKLDTNLECKVWGLSFPNPIGLAAGFDKNGECIDGMMDLGFGFVEIGSITPQPQDGNDKPRVWRLVEDEAVINRYGFNSDGHEVVRQRLQKRLENMNRNSYGKLGINLGKNKKVTEKDAVLDYMKGIEVFAEFADYLVINISSPNTPGLRDLQKRDIIHKLLSSLKETRDRVHDANFAKSAMASCIKCKPPPPPLLVKIAPDLEDNEIKDIAFVVRDVGIDGIIVNNTTISREDLKADKSVQSEYGGLSGRPMFEKSNGILRKVYKATEGKVPLIGVGGVSSVDDAYTKIKCGASLVQLYTGMIYNGPTLIHEMIDKLDECAKKDGFNHISEAVGSDTR